MRHLLTLLTMLFVVPAAGASGWLDYELDIGDGYCVFRANSLDISICREDGGIILHPLDYGVGPVAEYAMAQNYLFTRNLGAKREGSSTHDDHYAVVPEQSHYFIIVKQGDRVIGPLSETEFRKRPELTEAGDWRWHRPKNPNFWLPLIGTLFFLFWSLPFLITNHPLVAIPMLASVIALPLLCWVLVRRVRKSLAAKR
jgi:hypothetical protein